MADSPLDIARQITSGMQALSRAVDHGRRQALREVGAAARAEHMKHTTEVPGDDRKFSGTSKVNGGRLGVKVRYEYGDGEVRVSPAGPWGLPAGRGRTKPAFKSWDKGEASTTAQADQIVPTVVDREVQEAFRRG